MKKIDWGFWLILCLLIFGSGQLLAIVTWLIGSLAYPDFPRLLYVMLFWFCMSLVLIVLPALPGGDGGPGETFE